MEKLTDLLAVGETGLLITVDEVHAGAESDLRALFATYQHAVRDGREVAIVAAGLPSAVSDLLDDDVLTFLRRAHRVELAGVDDDAVRRAVAEPIAGSGVELSGAALDIAVESIRGYPFLIQLVGHLLWKAATGSGVVSVADARDVAARAPRRMGSMVHAPALRGLSAIDRTYLAAMAVDAGPSQTGEIARRMGVGAGYAQMYRRRLIDAELIEPVGRGLVDFSLPYLREYLREHVVTDALGREK